MTHDPFASSGVSLVLAWVCSIPLLVGGSITAVTMLFGRIDEAVPRWFLVWLVLCILVFSPVRYMFLQIILATAYLVQSWFALVSLIPLGCYVPVVFGLLYMVGFILPLVLTLMVAFGSLTQPKVSNARLAFGAVVAPLNMMGAYLLFFWLLPFAGWTVHWLRAEDVIGATNGPAHVVFAKVLSHFTPLPLAGYYVDVTVTDKDMLRNHVASFYLGRQSEAKYIARSYPDLYRRLTEEGTGQEQ